MKNADAIHKKLIKLRQFSIKYVLALLFCSIALISVTGSAGLSQRPSENISDHIQIGGIVLNAEGRPVKDAKVTLITTDVTRREEKTTNDVGAFTFSILKGINYSVSAEKLGERSSPVALPLATLQAGARIELVLRQQENRPELSVVTKPAPIQAIQFADQPNFTVAGVTDFTAVGGHGSDATLRTSEALAVETSNLATDGVHNKVETDVSLSQTEEQLRKSLAKSPGNFDANHRLGELYLQTGRYPDAIPLLEGAYSIDKSNRDNEYDLALACKAIGDPAHAKKYVQELISHQESAELLRLAGELDESLGDPLAAVREYQRAVSLDPSEQNFFSWGSELLLHRAIWQAQQVFEEGVNHYPASSRMLTGLGTALFSGAAYEQAALRLCEASDLNPSEPQPYIFLGKVQMAAPSQLDCAQQRLQRFQQQQPDNAVANYLYAMALQKGQKHASNSEAAQQSETLLRNAIALNPVYAEAYLQLGILNASRGNYDEAIALYSKAIQADPRLSDAHYRLAVAYDRTGHGDKAAKEFKLHDKIAKQDATEAEHQRQEVKQFVVLLPVQAPPAQTP